MPYGRALDDIALVDYCFKVLIAFIFLPADVRRSTELYVAEKLADKSEISPLPAS